MSCSISSCWTWYRMSWASSRRSRRSMGSSVMLHLFTGGRAGHSNRARFRIYHPDRGGNCPSKVGGNHG
jgi:hypothetical protein